MKKPSPAALARGAADLLPRQGPAAAEASISRLLSADHARPAVPTERIEELELDSLTIDDGADELQRIQPRADLNEQKAEEYAQVFREGGEMPPGRVYTDGSKRWLARGFHRYHGARRAGRTTLPYEVRTGTRRDAWLDAMEDNGQHGLPRSDADKRLLARKILLDPELVRFPDSDLGRRFQLSRGFMGIMRKEVLPATVDDKQPRPRLSVRGGKVIEIETSKIGSRQKEAAAARRELAAGDPSQPDLAAARRNDDAPPTDGVRRGADLDVHDPSTIIDWRAMGAAWSRKQDGKVPTDKAELRRLLAVAYMIELNCAKWGAVMAKGQGDRVRDQALHALVEGAMRAAHGPRPVRRR